MKITTSIQMLHGFTLTMAASATMLIGYATGPDINPVDLIEPPNCEVFCTNENPDKGMPEPVMQTYADVVPLPARTAVSNFFSDADDIYSAVNNLLQLEGTTALEGIVRVAINTVLGLGGPIDIASNADLPKHKEDFGQTLGVWGVPSGSYVVQPLLSPSTAHNTMGFLVDQQMDPLTYQHNSAITYLLTTLRAVDMRVNLLGASNVSEQTVVDKYTFLRNAYLQRRRHLIYDGNLPEDQDNAKSSGTGDTTASSYHHFAPN